MNTEDLDQSFQHSTGKWVSMARIIEVFTMDLPYLLTNKKRFAMEVHDLFIVQSKKQKKHIYIYLHMYI